VYWRRNARYFSRLWLKITRFGLIGFRVVTLNTKKMTNHSIDELAAGFQEKYPELTKFECLQLAQQNQILQAINNANGTTPSGRPHLSLIFDKLSQILAQLEKNG
jgi:hypothetical protein